MAAIFKGKTFILIAATKRVGLIQALAPMRQAFLIVVIAVLATGCASQHGLEFTDDLEAHFGEQVTITGVLIRSDRSADLCPPNVTEDVVGCLGLVGVNAANSALTELHAKCVTVTGVIAAPKPTREERGIGLRGSMAAASVAPCNGR